MHEVNGLGLLWQQRESMHRAHIRWPQSWTSIEHKWSKHMQHKSVSLACSIEKSSGYGLCLMYTKGFPKGMLSRIEKRKNEEYVNI